MKIKSQYYSIFFIVGILFLLIVSILIVTHWIISDHIEKQIESKINQFQLYVESTKNQVIEDRINFCKTIAKNKNLISAVENKDSEAIHSIMQSTYGITEKNNVLIKDIEENALLKSGIFKKETSVGKISESEDYKISILVIGSEHYLMFTVNVRDLKKNVGRIGVGYPFNDILRFKNINEIQYAILNGKQILNSSFAVKQELIAEFLNIHKPIADAVLATSRPSDMFSTIFDTDEIYSKILPFGSGVPLLVLVSVLKSDEFLFLDTLFDYLVYIFVVFSLMLLIAFFMIVNRKTKHIDNLNSEIKNLKEKPGESKEIVEEEFKESGSQPTEVVKDLKGTILISKIICSESELDDSVKNTLVSYQKIQSELLELYDGKVEDIIDYRMIASFSGSEDSIDKSIQCSQAIMKLINKESESTNCQIAIALNYGSIIYEKQETPELFGKTLELTEAILRVSNPGQILVQANQVAKTEMDVSKIKSKVWKFKNFKEEVRLVDLGLK